MFIDELDIDLLEAVYVEELLNDLTGPTYVKSQENNKVNEVLSMINRLFLQKDLFKSIYTKLEFGGSSSEQYKSFFNNNEYYTLINCKKAADYLDSDNTDKYNGISSFNMYNEIRDVLYKINEKINAEGYEVYIKDSYVLLTNC